ncbi:ABC transporter ATP-binding protein [Kitasatospora sp. NPDC057015]|uniref:ABC transporter ATP-binding protein n=1 Tax=Kitasatospora sp. NPDC057015 TaxID=3346001 RepID=UPI003631B332
MSEQNVQQPPQQPRDDDRQAVRPSETGPSETGPSETGPSETDPSETDPGAAAGERREEGRPADEELRFLHPGDAREAAGRSISALAMLRRLPQLVRRTLGLAWRVDRTSTVLLLVCQAVSGVLGAVALYATTGAIGALIAAGPVTGRLQQAAPSVALLAVGSGARALLGAVIVGLSERLSPRIGREAELELLTVATAAELSAYDNPGYNDRWDAADRGAETASDLLGDAQNIIASTISLAAAAGVLATLHPLLLPFLLLASLPQGMAAVRSARIYYLAMLDTIEDRRVLALLRWFLVDKDTADQVRSDTVADHLLDKYRRAGTRIDRSTNEASWKSARVILLGSAAAGFATALVWAVLLGLLAGGMITVASAGTAVFALRTASEGLQGMVSHGARLYRLGLYLDDLFAFLDEAGGHRIERGDLRPAAPEVVEVREVGYSYQDADRPALTGVNLTVRRGEIVALIGENGSGKSTLLKLISALYLPTEGVVSWDGVPTGDLDAHAAWRFTARVPQDFARWPMTARENIELGGPSERGDTAVREAAALCGADEVLDSLRKGLDTLLARQWWGGQELSAGQWQRFAVARSFFRSTRNPGLLILDEPTSALDPRAEHRIFKNLRELARDRAVLLVTHNLGNVVVADRIVVMREGRIIQQGSWDELSSRPGLFRELLDLQRDRGVPGQRRATAG